MVVTKKKVSSDTCQQLYFPWGWGGRGGGRGELVEGVSCAAVMTEIIVSTFEIVSSSGIEGVAYTEVQGMLRRIQHVILFLDISAPTHLCTC